MEEAKVQLHLMKSLHCSLGKVLDYVQYENGAIGVVRGDKVIAAIVPFEGADAIRHLREIEEFAYPSLEHKAEPQPRDSAALPWRAVCGCGWQGPRRTVFAGSSKDAAKHNKEMLKQKGKVRSVPPFLLSEIETSKRRQKKKKALAAAKEVATVGT